MPNCRFRVRAQGLSHSGVGHSRDLWRLSGDTIGLGTAGILWTLKGCALQYLSGDILALDTTGNLLGIL